MRTTLRQLYAQLCRDETPMVRRSAAAKLGSWSFSDDKGIHMYICMYLYIYIYLHVCVHVYLDIVIYALFC